MARLHIVEQGSGHPVVALHGFGPDHRSIVGFLEPTFARHPGYRRIYLDLPGFGRSPIGTLTSTAELVDVVEQQIAELVGDDRFLLVGQSDGGYLAAEISRRRRTQVAGLALVCPLVVPQFRERDVPPHQIVVRDPDATAGLELAERVAFETIAVVQTRETLARYTDEVASGLELHDVRAASRLQSSGYALPSSPFRGEAIDCPTLIIAGRQDAIVGFADQLTLASHYPRATIAVLDAAGHNAQLERPDLIMALLGDWLTRADVIKNAATRGNASS